MINLKHYGYTEPTNTPDSITSGHTSTSQASGQIPGRITEHQRELYTVITQYGEVTASLKGTYYHSTATREDFPCVGDFVLLQYNQSGESRITELLPRKSKFSRADFSGHAAGYAKTIKEQVVAANFDYVFILTSLNADFNANRVLRYMTQAQQGGGQPVIILTKADLAGDYSWQLAEMYTAVQDTPVHAISSHTGHGMEELAQYLQPGKTIVFLGMSGVGKSSLLNALMDETVMTVSAIREDDARGRHTTTHRQLFMLPSGAMVIDTPGMRELGLFNAEEGISASFADVEELFTQCRFSDCAHKTEPGCAVREAIMDGSLPQERWGQYQAQMRENRFVDDKAAFMRERHAASKAIAAFTKSAAKASRTKKKK